MKNVIFEYGLYAIVFLIATAQRVADRRKARSKNAKK